MKGETEMIRLLKWQWPDVQIKVRIHEILSQPSPLVRRYAQNEVS